MGAVAGILIADYWVLRRCQLSTRGLFQRDGEYAYSHGINYRAMAVLVAAVLPVGPGFVRAALTPGGQVANPNIFDTLYSYAWFVTFGLSFGLYLLLHSRRR
jgi:NCS1 family nucleobase:cation symporter-1